MSTNHSATRYYANNDVTLFAFWKMEREADEDNLNFVKLVKKHPVLWRTDHKRSVCETVKGRVTHSAT